MAAYALEAGSLASVTAVLRSNYNVVKEKGFDIDSIEWGRDIKGWRPTTSKLSQPCRATHLYLHECLLTVRNTIPEVEEEGLDPFDFIIVTTKVIPESPPSVAEIIAPAVTPSHTAILLSQNGLNIEKPLIEAFPSNPLISSISLISVAEKGHGRIVHEDKDIQHVGPFFSPGVSRDVSEAAARRFMRVYNAKGILRIDYEEDVQRTRWRKLVYNASFNTVAAVLRMDTTTMRMSEHVITDLVRPIMYEIMSAASAAGYDLPADLPERTIRVDPTHLRIKPSMCQDIEKGQLMEIRTIAKEPLDEGERRGVDMPVLRSVYGMLKGLQLKMLEERGLWERKFVEGNPWR